LRKSSDPFGPVLVTGRRGTSGRRPPSSSALWSCHRLAWPPCCL